MLERPRKRDSIDATHSAFMIRVDGKIPEASTVIFFAGTGKKLPADLSSALIFGQSASGVSPYVTDDAITDRPLGCDDFRGVRSYRMRTGQKSFTAFLNDASPDTKTDAFTLEADPPI
jgi:xanthine dehydrogenase iron-sulfur cluster and FAD-binding subunit A